MKTKLNAEDDPTCRPNPGYAARVREAATRRGVDFYTCLTHVTVDGTTVVSLTDVTVAATKALRAALREGRLEVFQELAKEFPEASVTLLNCRRSYVEYNLVFRFPPVKQG